MNNYAPYNEMTGTFKEKPYKLYEVTKDVIKHEYFDLKQSVFALCDSGRCELEIHGRRIVFSDRVRASVLKVNLVHVVNVSDDFHAWAIAADNKFWLNLMTGVPAEMLQNIGDNPVVEVKDDNEWTILLNFIESLRCYEELASPSVSQAMVGTLIRGIIVLQAEMTRKDNPKKTFPNHTMADRYYRNFITLVNENVDREHEVQYYASQLGISTKYLSDISKSKVNHSAKEVISFFLLSRLKQELLVTGSSLKTIAYRLSFSDQSSMGKFFRKMEGISPLEFRRRNSVATMSVETDAQS